MKRSHAIGVGLISVSAAAVGVCYKGEITKFFSLASDVVSCNVAKPEVLEAVAKLEELGYRSFCDEKEGNYTLSLR